MTRLQTHNALHQIAISMSAVFSAAYLLKLGLTYTEVFMAFAGIFALRILMRPIIMPLLPVFGMRRMLIAGTILVSGQYCIIAFVKGFDWTLLAYVVFTAFANMLYWTLFHPVFAAAGERHTRGKQTATRQSISSLSGILGPAISGFLLSYSGPWVAFGAAAIIAIISAWPLFGMADYPVAKQAPPNAWRASKMCSALFLSDGFLWLGAGMAWSMMLFERMGGRFDSYGLVLGLTAVAGAIASLTIGHSIDLGHGGKAVAISASLAAMVYASRALVGENTLAVVAVLMASSVLINFYTPTFMTAYYNLAKQAPCPFRLQCAAETGWDLGAVLGCLGGVAIVKFGFDIQAVVWLAAIPIVAEAVMLLGIYKTEDRVDRQTKGNRL